MKIHVNIHKNNFSLRARKLGNLLIYMSNYLFLPLFLESPHRVGDAAR